MKDDESYKDPLGIIRAIEKGRATRISSRHWLTKDIDGRLVKSRRTGHGRFDALFGDPRSLANPESNYRKVLSVMTELGESSKIITARFNDRFSTDNGSNWVTSYLASLVTFGLVTCEKSPLDGRVHLWSLSPGIDIADGEALYRAALSHVSSLKGERPVRSDK
jgi:hypothetical protein